MCLYSSNNCPKTKGILAFTLIEFLIVATVIILLTSIILASLTSFKNKAQDARIMAGTAQVRNIAEAIIKDHNSYNNLCGNGTLNEEAPLPYGEQLSALENDIRIRQGGTINMGCQASFNSYCLDVNLISPDKGRYCIDDDGHAMTTVESFRCATATTTCQ